MARNFIKLFQSLGLWTVLIALFLPTEGSPGLADGQRPRTTDGPGGSDQSLLTTEHTEHTEKGTEEEQARIPGSSFRVFRGSISVAMAHETAFNHEPDRPSHSCPSCDPWSSLPFEAGAVVRGGPTARAGPVFRVSAGFTPAKTQNEANLRPISEFSVAISAAILLIEQRERGPPRREKEPKSIVVPSLSEPPDRAAVR
ncbi:MAG: hypothetical protein ACYC61_18270, partial [Isosphaeraceae bacterium]